MSKKDKTPPILGKMKGLVSQISEIYLSGQQKAITAINTHLVETYWKIGQYIVEFEQVGKGRIATTRIPHQ